MTSIASALPYIQIVLSVLLVAAILLQRGDSDLGSAFGSSDASGGGSSYFTRRGFEKTLFNTTIVLVVLFVASAIAALVL